MESAGASVVGVLPFARGEREGRTSTTGAGAAEETTARTGPPAAVRRI